MKPPIKFVIGAYEYQTKRRLNGFEQLEILRSLSPVFASGAVEILGIVRRVKVEGLLKIATEIMAAGDVQGSHDALTRKFGLLDMPIDKFANAAPNVARELAAMPRDTVRMILATIMSVMQRHEIGAEIGGWFDIYNDQAKRCAFDDIQYDLSLMLRICWPVLLETLEPFFPVSLSELLGGAAT